MRQLLRLALLLMLVIPTLAQSTQREHENATDIRERLKRAEELRSENRSREAVELLESTTTDLRLQSDPILRSHLYFDLARARASVGDSEGGMEALKEGVRGGGINYRDLEREHHSSYTTDGNMLLNGGLL